MLQKIRQHAQGWIAGIIVGILSVVFALWGIQYYLHGSGAANVVAKVNGTEIDNSELQASYQQLRQNMQSQLGNSLKFTPELQKILRKQALQSIINRAVISQAATESGFRISPQQISAVIQQMPSFQIDGQFSPSLFQQILNRLSYSEDSFVKQLKQSLLIAQLQTGISASSFSLPNEVRRAVLLTEQKRDIGYTVVSVKNLLPKVNVTDQQIQTYYNQHKNDYSNPPQVSINYVELSADQLKKEISVSEQELKDYYQNNIAAFSSPAKWQIQRIAETIDKSSDTKAITEVSKKIIETAHQITAGKKFEDFSPTAPEWIEASRFNTPIIRALKDLKPNEVTEPITLTDSFVIVKLLQYQPATPKPFNDVKARVKDVVLKQKIEHEFLDLSNQMSEQAYTNPESLQPIGDALSLKVQTSELFAKKGGTSAVTSNSNVIQAAFSDEVLQEGNNSNLIEIEPGRVIVLRVKEHIPSKPKPLAEVREAIETTLRQHEATKLAEKQGEQMLKQISDSTTVSKTVSDAGFTWHEMQNVTRHQPTINAELLRIAFRLPNPEIAKKPSLVARSLSNGDIAIVKINKIHENNDLKISDTQKNVYSRAIEQGYAKLEFDLFVNSLMKQAKIQIYNDAANS